MVLALEVFGYNLPNPAYGLVIVGFMIAFLLINRSSPEAAETTGRGPWWHCTRCGFEFQPEQVELMSTGDVRRVYGEQCPNCTSDDTEPK